jgi:peptidoglycan L-alanyl-D-glutamate endopeptidase CwlK
VEVILKQWLMLIGTVSVTMLLALGGDWTPFRDVAHIEGRRNSELAANKRESGL